MKYEFNLDQNEIMHVTFYGDLEESDVLQYMADIEPILSRHNADNPLYTIIHSHTVGKFSSGARRQFSMLGQDPRLGKLCVLDANRFIRVVAKFVTKVSGRDGDMKFFDSEAEAIAWLKQEQSTFRNS